MNAVTKIEAAVAVFYAIDPRTAELTPITASSPLHNFMITGLKAIFDTGKCPVVTLPSGDRVVAGPGRLGPIKGNAEMTALAEEEGYFAVLDGAPVTVAQLDSGEVTPWVEDDAAMTELVGPALVIGPVPTAEGAEQFTQVVASQEQISGSLGWSLPAMKRALARQLAQKVGAAAGSTTLLDMLEGARAKNAAVDRDDVSDDELAECGCAGCLDELARRTDTSTEVAGAVAESKRASKH